MKVWNRSQLAIRRSFTAKEWIIVWDNSDFRLWFERTNQAIDAENLIVYGTHLLNERKVSEDKPEI